MTKKLVIIGFDGFDKDLMKSYSDDLPTLNKIFNSNQEISMKSTFPYDSETAWATIYSGLNPAKTGIVHFENPFVEKKTKIDEKLISNQMKNNTFWDCLSNNGKRVCVLFPHACYPGWDVNGIMVCRSMKAKESRTIQAHPDNTLDQYKNKNFDTMRDMPTQSTISKTIKDAEKLVQNELDLGISLYTQRSWDLFFIYSSTADFICHCFWHYCDERDPYYIKNDEMKGVIKKFYIQYDNFVETFLNKIDNDTGLIIISDHGHGMRPTRVVNFNEMFRKNKLIDINKKGININKNYERLLRILKGIISKYELSAFAQVFFARFPKLKEDIAKSKIIDYPKSICHVSDPSAIKSYSYGGIVINQKAIKSSSHYEGIRNQIFDMFEDLVDPSTGTKIFQWVKRRDDLYEGPFLDRYPDILFELNENYGVGWEICTDLITQSKTHLIQPGGHKLETPILLCHNLPQPKRVSVDLMDIAPTVTELFDIKMNCEGRSIFSD